MHSVQAPFKDILANVAILHSLCVWYFSVLRTLGPYPKVLHTKRRNLYIRGIQYVSIDYFT